jgi:D-alanyl-D-alanine carboxypeptidase/D-alanyl-D-alanine-endopeptidase (penicillin-binding protein 4)
VVGAVLGLLVSAAPAAAIAPDVPARTPIVTKGSPAASVAAVSRSGLRRGLASLARGAGGGTGVWAYDVDANDHRSLFGFHPRTRRILASNTKLFTTSTALDRLGPGKSLKTSAWGKGPPEHGVLSGGLFLVGDGDPTLASASFARHHNTPLTRLRDVARDVRSAGVRRVKGPIHADGSIFDARRGIPATGFHTSSDLGPLSGLTYNSGMIGGHYSGDPARQAGKAFRAALRKSGVKVAGKVDRRKLPGGLRDQDPLGSARSPELRRIVAATNKPSNNYFAEMLLKRLGANPGGAKGTTRRGARVVRRFAHKRGAKVRTKDGSGLSRNDRASPQAVGKLLVAMRHDPAKEAFSQSLPIAGREGTVSNRMRGTAAAGHCRTKTGTLNGVSALSGYCFGAGHGTVAFSILMNGVGNIISAHKIQDRMAALIARYKP